MKHSFPVSIVITNFNAGKSLRTGLKSIADQTYRAREIIIIDNNSTDDSIAVIKRFKKSMKMVPVILIAQKENMGQMTSYIKGIRTARSDYIVTMHSDARITSPFELEKLVKPILYNKKVVATYPIVLHSTEVWKTYNFWEKLHFSRVVGTEERGLNGKFDCFERRTLVKISQDWQVRFANTNAAGGEDWDLYNTLKKEGQVVSTDARIEHLHQVSSFDFADLLVKRKHMARTYGKILGLYGLNVGVKGMISFLSKPILAVFTLIPGLHLYFIPILVIYAFIYNRKMFLNTATMMDFRIILLPFVNIFLVYYEGFWTVESYLSFKKII